MKIVELIEELQKEVRHGHEDIYVHTEKQLLPNAYYEFDLGVNPDGRPTIEILERNREHD